MVNYCEELDSNYYGKLLNDLQNNIGKLKQINSKITNDVYLDYFTDLLVSYKLKYETEKIQDIINQESLWKHLSKILISDIEFYLELNIQIPKGLINKMLNQKHLLNPELTKKLLSFSESIEDLLFMINNNFDSIYIVFNKDKSYINIEQLKKQNVSDNLIMLQKDIELLIKKQEKVGYKLIIFDQNFWSFYLNNYKKDFKSLRLIEQIIIKYKRIDNNINVEEISKMIHETEIKKIKSGELKNEKLLDFFFNYYIKFNENNNNIYFPLFYVDGIDLDLADSIFFKKWEQFNIISYIAYDHHYFCQKIINKLNKIEDLSKIFLLFQK